MLMGLFVGRVVFIICLYFWRYEIVVFSLVMVLVLGIFLVFRYRIFRLNIVLV